MELQIPSRSRIDNRLAKRLTRLAALRAVSTGWGVSAALRWEGTAAAAAEAPLGTCCPTDPQRPAQKPAPVTSLGCHGEPGSAAAPGEDKGVVDPAHSSVDLNQQHVTGDQSQ